MIFKKKPKRDFSGPWTTNVEEKLQLTFDNLNLKFKSTLTNEDFETIKEAMYSSCRFGYQDVKRDPMPNGFPGYYTSKTIIKNGEPVDMGDEETKEFWNDFDELMGKIGDQIQRK